MFGFLGMQFTYEQRAISRTDTPPNHGGGNRLVCISDDNEVRRLPRKQAAELVANGWYYVAKMIYKATHRK